MTTFVVIIGFLGLLMFWGNKKGPVNKIARELGEAGDSPMTSEADRIEAIVKKRKEEANKKGLPKLVEELWEHQGVRYFHSWIQQNRNYVPAFVQEATESKSKRDGKDKDTKTISLRLESKTLSFAFTETSSYDGTNYGELDLIVSDKTVLSLGMAIDYGDIKNEWDSAHWHAFDVTAYIPGDWENDLHRLKSEIEKLRADRERAAKEDPAKLNDMKKRFGIE